MHGGSVARLVMASFPLHNWEVWRFNQVPRGAWNDTRLQRQYFQELQGALGLSDLDGWYSVSFKTLSQHKGAFVPS
jgi:hypothetical protein